MMATGSPRASAPASPAKPATRGVPPRISTFTTATSAESATPTSRPANHWRLPENLIAIRRGSVAVIAHQDVPVGDQRALRVGGERRAAEDLAVRELNDEQGDRVLILEREGAIVHRDRAREASLPYLRGVERRAEPGDGPGVATRARGCKLGPQPPTSVCDC